MAVAQFFCVLLQVISLVQMGQGRKCRARKVVTFNTGLTPFLGNYETRSDLMPDAINSIDADVLCLQEVWYEKDMKKIIDTVKENYPYAYSPLHNDITRGGNTTPWSPDNSPSCSATDPTVQAFQNCAAGCATDPDVVTCVLSMCLETAFGMPQKCLTCIFVGFRNLTTVADFCFTPDNRVNLEGLLILSKRRIKSAQTMRYWDIPGVKLLLPRSYMDVWIKGTRNVICTHLTGDLGEPYMEGVLAAVTQGNLNIDSWDAQQEHEIATLRAHLAASGKHILAGDMNTGPVLANIDGEFPDKYAILANGYYNDFFDSDDAECTFCSSNELSDFDNNILIDHILVKGYETTNSKRVLDTGDVTLSDHYGVQTDVCL